MNENDHNPDESSEKAVPKNEGDGNNAENSSYTSVDDVGAENLIAKPKVKRSRKPKGDAKTGKSQQVKLTGSNISRSQHLHRLNLVEMGVMLLISLLNACQIAGRSLDRNKVRLYREMLDIQFPPNIIVIKAPDGKYYIASGHHRVAAALEAGYLEVRCDVYEGSIADAIIVGGEENQGPAPMTLAAKKALLDTLLSLEDGPQYSISQLGAMTGLERHTIAKHKDERDNGGDFITLASNMKQDKSPEEQLYDAAKGIVRNTKKHGIDVIAKALDLMQPHLREEVLARIAPKSEA